MRDTTDVSIYAEGADSPVDVIEDGDGVNRLAIDNDNKFKVETVIEDTAYNLQSAAYSETATPTEDYIIDNVSFEFTTAETRTITILSDNGAKIYESVGNTNLTVVVSDINIGQEGSQSFTVNITQTSGACLVDVTAQIKNSNVALTSSPITQPGSKVSLQDKNSDDIDEDNRLDVQSVIYDVDREKRARVEYNDRLATQNPDPYHISTRFYGDFLDEEVWAKLQNGTGTVTPGPTYIEMETGSSPSSTDLAVLASRRFKEPSVGQLSHWVGLVAWDNLTVTNLQRAWGLFSLDRDNGYFFELIDGVLYATILKNGSYTRENIDSFRGTTGGYDRYDIYHTAFRVRFVINGTQVYTTNSIGSQPLIEEANLTPVAGIQAFNKSTDTPFGATPSSQAFLRCEMLAYADPTLTKTILTDLDDNVADITRDGELSVKAFGSINFSEGFWDSTLDTVNRWESTIVSSATNTVTNTILNMSVTTSSTSATKLVSRQPQRCLSALSRAKVAINGKIFPTTEANNKRELGLADDNDADNAYFFRYQNGILYAVAVNDGTETTKELDFTVVNQPTNFVIERRCLSEVDYYINGIKYWSFYSDTGPIIKSKDTRIYLNNENTGSVSAISQMSISSASIIDSSQQSVQLVGKDENDLFRNVAVDSTGALKVVTSAQVDDVKVNQYEGFSTAQNKISYTVPSGKNLFIQELFTILGNDGGTIVTEWQEDGTGFAAATVQDNATTSFQLNTPTSSPFGPFSSGTVIRASRVSGDSGKDWATGFVGFLEDA